MADKLPSYIEFIPQTDDKCAAYEDSGGSDGCDLSYIMDDSSTKNEDYNARDCANRGGGEDTTRDVSLEDLEAMKRMVHDMLRNPELLHVSPFSSEIVGGVASSSTQDEIMTVASFGVAAVSHASPSSSPVKCEATFMPVTPTTTTKTTITMSPYLCQECNCSVPPPLPVRTSPTRTVTMPWAPPLPFR